MRTTVAAWCLLVCLVCVYGNGLHAQPFTMESVAAYPFFSGLSTTPNGARAAVAVVEQGKRNVYVAEGPVFKWRKITAYDNDDGQEITSVTLSADGQWVIYVRGGDHGAYDETKPRNPASAPTSPAIQLFSIPFTGGTAVCLGEGDYPVISPGNDKVLFTKKGQAWIAPLNGSVPAKAAFYARGSIGSLQWSPDGKRISFVATREDHSFIGIYTNEQTAIQWLAPGFYRDLSPKWSPDGRQIVFIRRPASGGAPDSLMAPRHEAWSVCIANPESGTCRIIWKAPTTLRGSVPGTQGRFNLQWTAGDRIAFVSYLDGWPHLYSIPAAGGSLLLLTPGHYSVEHIKLSPDKKWFVYSMNGGPDAADKDRRHIARVPVDKDATEQLTAGTGIESYPAFIDNGNSIMLLSATAQRPTLPAIMPVLKGKMKLLGQELIPAGFPQQALVTPTSVSFKAADGLEVYAQLFKPIGPPAKKPAIVFIHGGPQRQMLTGWHYLDYYANTYALNQYLVNQGFIVLSVNYRLGSGYGYEFQYPQQSGIYGAAEYLDIKAAGEWLAAQAEVDAQHIGVYGGSYGGFLTAMALAKDSKLFAAGVDIHGEHNYLKWAPKPSYEPAPDASEAVKRIWASSPVAWLDHWTSPVLLIHGDDDGNVEFAQSVDLVRRLEQKQVPYETLVIPDETHHWMLYKHMVQVNLAIAAFLKTKLVNIK